MFDVQMQTAVTAYFTSKQLLLSAFTMQHNTYKKQTTLYSIQWLFKSQRP